MCQGCARLPFSQYVVMHTEVKSFVTSVKWKPNGKHLVSVCQPAAKGICVSVSVYVLACDKPVISVCAALNPSEPDLHGCVYVHLSLK